MEGLATRAPHMFLRSFRLGFSVTRSDYREGLNPRMRFSWTWPYRSIVAAKDFRPSHVILDPEEAFAQCDALSLQTKGSRYPRTLSTCCRDLPAPSPLLPTGSGYSIFGKFDGS
jgi:hypothetical protein